MIKKKVLLICLSVLVVASVAVKAQYVYIIRARNVGYFFATSNTLNFNFYNETVSLNVIAGNLSTTVNNLGITADWGIFRFTALNTTQLRVSYDVPILKVTGDSGNTLRPIRSGSTVTIAINDDVQIIWNRVIEPSLPFAFILGVIGLVCCFGGPLYTIQKSKEKKYRDAFVTGLTVTVLGLALVISWLYG